MDDTGAAPRTSTGKVSDSDLKLQAIERLLLLAQRYITVVEVSAMQPLHWYAKSPSLIHCTSSHLHLPCTSTL